MAETLKFLLIEDDEDDYVLARDLLNRAFAGRHTLDWIDDWELALETIVRNEHDACLVDYRLGKKDGLELVQCAVERGCDVPIILLTGLDHRDIDIEAIKAGAADYLVKGTISPDLLEKSVRYCLARQQFLCAERETRTLLKQKNKKLARLYETAHQFVDNVSHEFRTPLTVIKEFASILQDGLAGEVSGEQREFLTIILNRVDDLSLMTDDMLDISKIEAGLLGVAHEETQIEQIVEHVRTTLERKAAANGATLEIAIESALPAIYCDPEKIGRVIINLAVNAFKFSGEGGKVALWARDDGDRSQIIVGVTDDGPGIAPESLQAIFARFKQAGGEIRASTKGFGLGLNIAKELVDVNFGDLEVDSEIGRGSTFSFSVPAFEPEQILERYLKRINYFHDSASSVSLIKAQIEPPSEAALANDVKRFLQYQIRHGDLLFETGPDAFLICAGANQEQLDEMIARIVKAQSDANRGRLDKDLPVIEFEVLGTWRVHAQRARFIDRFKAEYAVHAVRERDQARHRTWRSSEILSTGSGRAA